VRLWETATGAEEHDTALAHDEQCEAAAFSTARQVATAADDAAVRV